MKSVTDAIRERYSVRGFQPQEVDEGIIRDVLEIARLSPSNGNSQPWHIAVVSGNARAKLEKAIFSHIANGGRPNPHFPPGGKGLTGAYKDRQRACGFSYYSTMGVERNDEKGRMELAALNWKFFGAPHALFLSMPKTMHRANAIDLGIMMQSLMLLFAERGIATCPQGALAAFPDQVKDVVSIPEENAILCGMSFGYEEEGAHINTVRMEREPLEKIATFAR